MLRRLIIAAICLLSLPFSALAQYTPLSPNMNGVQTRQALDQRFNGTVPLTTSSMLQALGSISGTVVPNAQNGLVFTATLSGNVTFNAPINIPAGTIQTLQFIVAQAASGGPYTTTWAGAYVGTIPSQTTSASAFTTYSFVCAASGPICYWAGGGPGAAGSGVVDSGTTGQFATYPSNGTTVSGHTLASSDLTTPLTTPPPIGATTPNTGAFTTLSGSVNGVINVMNQAGASNSLQTLSVTTNGSTTISATGIGASTFGAFTSPNYQWIAIPGAGPTPSVSTPTGLHVMSMHSLAAPTTGTHNTTWAENCSAVNPFASCASGGTTCILSNNYMVEVGNSITIDGAGTGGANLSTSITAIDYRGVVTLNNTVVTTVSQAVTSVGNCTTDRSYRARAIDIDGGMSAPTSAQTLTTSANAENWSNFDLFEMNTQSNAVAYACETCEGSSCSDWNLYDVEVPTYSYADVTDLSFPYTDYLLNIGLDIGQSKVNPGIIYCHNFGHSFGNDVNNGGTQLPSGAVNQIYYGSLTAVSTNSGTVTPAPTQSVTSLLYHDIGPAINSAFAQACQLSNNYQCQPVYLPEANTGTLPGYYMLTPVVLPTLSQGLRFDTGLTVVAGDATQQACTSGTRPQCFNAINWVGGLGVTPFSAISAGRLEIEHLQLNGPTTMGVGVDIDEPASFAGSTTTAPVMKNSSIGCASVPERRSNINGSNVEFGVHDNVYEGFCTPPNGSGQDGQPAVGLLINSVNSLKHVLYQDQINGQIGILNTQGSLHMDSGQFCGNGDIGVWSSAYQADQFEIDNTRNEFCSRAWYGNISGGSTWNNAPILRNNTFAAIVLPADGVFILSTGSGSLELDHNLFSTTMWGNNGTCSYPFPNTFISVVQANFSKASSQGNWYDAMTYNTAFANLPAQYMTSTADYGSGDGVDCNFTPFVIPSVTPTFITINASCAPTIKTTQNTIQKTACSINNVGGAVIFPYTLTGPGPTFWGTFAVQTGQATCDWNVLSANDMSSGNVRFVDSENNANNLMCTNTCGNPDTLNLCFKNSTGFYLENNTGISTLSLLATINFGVP